MDNNKPHAKKLSLISSAPAKIIFSGEHAVVYGSGAIACAIDLRTRIKTEIKLEESNSNNKNKFILYSENLNCKVNNTESLKKFAELDLDFILNSVFEGFYCEFKNNFNRNNAFENNFTKYCDELFEKINEINIQKLQDSYGNMSIQDFTSKVLEDFGALNVNCFISSDIPYFGSGLGSSGSFNVVLANTFLNLIIRADEIKENLSNKENTSFSLNEKSAKKLSLQQTNQITLIVSYLGEKIFHLKPSGIDNVTIILGGIIHFSNFQSKNFQKKNNLFIQKLKEKFLFYLIDTKVKRNTSTFIKQVSNFKSDFSVVFENSVNSIANLVLKLNNILSLEKEEEKIGNEIKFDFDEKKQKSFFKILEINQHLLSVIQVSSKEIDFIVQSMKEIDVVAKLTGAGGGGFVLAAVEIRMINKFIEACRNKDLSFIQCNLSEEGLKTEFLNYVK